MKSQTERRLRAWSYSSLINFEMCPYLAWLKHGAKVPETGDRTALDRGIAIHTAAEDFVQGKSAVLAPELKHFTTEMTALRRQFEKGKVSVEGEWAFTSTWTPTDWRASEAWCRMKCDAVYMPNRTEAVIIDYKSGKRFGNEIKHAEQVQLYAIGAFLRNEKLEHAVVELYYTDQNELTSQGYTRSQAMKYLPTWTNRASKMTSATQFPPKPNIFVCARCAYGPNKSGECKAGVSLGERKRQSRARFEAANGGSKAR